jgi:signal transduction histidine kinase/CheY-like chemotaxis protein
MKRSRFRRVLRWALAGPITLLAVLAMTFLALIRWLNTEVEWVDHTDRVISATQETQSLVLDMETGVRGYLLTRDDSFLSPYKRAAPVMGTAFSELRRLVEDNPQQVAAAFQLQKDYGDWQQLAAQLLQSNRNVSAETGQIAAKEQMDVVRRDFARFIDVEEGLRRSRTDAVQRVTRVVVGTSIVAALLFGLLVGMVTRRALQSVASDYESVLAESDSARVRAEGLAVENERLFRQAQSASSAKDEFLATLSHELRTPLTAILGWSRLLQMQPGRPEDINVALASIERSARSQAALIEDILDVSRIITGKMKLDTRTVDLRDAVREAVDSLKPAAAAKNIVIDVEAPETLLLSADPNRLQQIIWNLLANSVKFSSAGTRIRVDARRVRDDVVLRVADEGRGIESAFLPFVFDRFRQADSTSTREFGGLGIGLSVVKLLVELHGGSVRADSAGLGKGATFIVTFPISFVPRAMEDSGRRAMEVSVETIARPLAGCDFLVVDDDSEARDVIAAMLRAFGGRVEVASNVREAMEILAKRKFALILTDIAMPVEDGQSFLRRLRASNGPNSVAPVVAVTALTAAAMRDDDSKFAATIRKPVDPAVLVTIVESMIR